MPASDDLRDGMAEAFDALSEEFQAHAVVTMLKVSDTDDEFTEIMVLENKRFFEYSNFRKNTLMEIADASVELTETMADATHVRIDNDNESTVYTIIAGDTIAPSGTQPFWQLYLDLFERRTHYTRL